MIGLSDCTEFSFVSLQSSPKEKREGDFMAGTKSKRQII